MKEEDVLIPLTPVYQKKEITFIQGKGIELYPEGTSANAKSYVVYESTDEKDKGGKKKLLYDYLINATGPKLNFESTKGLGPDFYTYSVCTSKHAKLAGTKLEECIEEMKKGKQLTLVVGMGHGTCTCEGAAFEYVFNVDTELRRHNVRENAQLVYLTNEAQLGDFGVDGIQLDVGGYITPFKGHLLRTYDRSGVDISDKIFNPNQFMKVDADYAPKIYQEWKASDSNLLKFICYRNCVCNSPSNFTTSKKYQRYDYYSLAPENRKTKLFWWLIPE